MSLHPLSIGSLFTIHFHKDVRFQWRLPSTGPITPGRGRRYPLPGPATNPFLSRSSTGPSRRLHGFTCSSINITVISSADYRYAAECIEYTVTVTVYIRLYTFTVFYYLYFFALENKPIYLYLFIGCHANALAIFHAEQWIFNWYYAYNLWENGPKMKILNE